MLHDLLHSSGNLLKSAKYHFVPASIDATLECVEEGIDQALEFLGSEGIRIEIRPTVAYVDDSMLSAGIKGRLASVSKYLTKDTEDAHWSAFLRYLRKFMSEGYGLSLSDDALFSFSSATSPKTTIELPDTDIHIYNQARNHHNLAPTMVHELWHIKELEEGIFDFFANEGTATYAQNRFRRKSSPWYNIQEDSWRSKWGRIRLGLQDYPTTMHYRNAAHIVEKNLEVYDEPLVALLDPDIRAAVSEAVEQKVFPHIYAPPFRNFPLPLDWLSDYYLVSSGEAFSAFRQERSPESLVNSFRGLGHELLAHELQSQDLTKLAGYFADFLPPKRMKIQISNRI